MSLTSPVRGLLAEHVGQPIVAAGRPGGLESPPAGRIACPTFAQNPKSSKN